MRSYGYAWLIAALVLAGGCGGASRQEQTQKEAEKGVAQSAQEMAKGFESMAKGLQQMAGSADQKPVEPVSFQQLEGVFPDLPGWDKGKPTGERMTSPVSYAEATVSYTKGESEINAKIVDSGLNQLLIAPFSMFLVAGYEKQTEDGYEKSVKVGDFPGWEKWSGSNKDGELNALVAKRFVVTFEGHGLGDTKVLYELAQRTDFGKLAGLK